MEWHPNRQCSKEATAPAISDNRRGGSYPSREGERGTKDRQEGGWVCRSSEYVGLDLVHKHARESPA